MQIYEKVRWLADLRGKKITDFFSSDKLGHLRKLRSQLEELSISFGYNEMSIEDLAEFTILYEKEILTRENSKKVSLIDRYSGDIGTGQIYFIYLRNQDGHLLGGALLAYRNNSITLAFKATDSSFEPPMKLRSGIGNMIDFIFFNLAIDDFHPDFISFGKDRNAYGLLGSKTTLAMTKLTKKLLPYDFEGNKQIEVDTGSIDVETLIFINKNEDQYLTGALLYVPVSMTEDEVRIRYGSLFHCSLIQTRVITF